MYDYDLIFNFIGQTNVLQLKNLVVEALEKKHIHVLVDKQSTDDRVTIFANNIIPSISITTTEMRITYPGSPDFTKDDLNKFIEIIKDLITLLGSKIDNVIGGSFWEFKNYYDDVQFLEVTEHPFNNSIKFIFFPFWIIYLTNSAIEKIGNSLIDNSPAWRKIPINNGILLINSQNPLNPSSKEVAEYFYNQLKTVKEKRKWQVIGKNKGL